MYTHFNFRGMHCTDKKRERDCRKKQNNSYSTQLISLRNLLIKRKKKNRHLKAYVELDGPSSGSIKVCRVNTAMSYCPFIFQLNKTLIFITVIQESLFLISKQVERKDEKRKKREAVGLQFRSVSLNMNSKRTSDTHKTPFWNICILQNVSATHSGMYNVDGSESVTACIW